jgi:CheY-like chemotaxis protein
MLLDGMNGELKDAERLRTNPELQGIVLVALTGYGEHQDRKRSKDAGFDRHFVRPLSLKALQELLATLPEPSP